MIRWSGQELAFAMTNFGAHPAFLTAGFASARTAMLATHPLTPRKLVPKNSIVAPAPQPEGKDD
jgi:hypothetical protein